MTKKMKLKRIGLLSAVKIGGTVSAVMGFILGAIWGVVMAFFSSLAGAVFSMDTAGMGAAWLIISPFLSAFLYGILGTILSLLTALVYNIAAGILGGIEVETQDSEKKVYNDIYGEM
ncbi:DUF3566 domain-containing protein [Candidatus Latescibacterota bacterium]